jgi:hypothetical protein
MPVVRNWPSTIFTRKSAYSAVIVSSARPLAPNRAALHYSGAEAALEYDRRERTMGLEEGPRQIDAIVCSGCDKNNPQGQ